MISFLKDGSKPLITTDNENTNTYTSFNGVFKVLEFHHNIDIWVLLQGENFDMHA